MTHRPRTTSAQRMLMFSGTVLLICLSACGRLDRANDYAQAKRQDSVLAYEDFLRKYPDEPTAPEIRRLLEDRQRKAAAEQEEGKRRDRQAQLEKESAARREAEQNQALQCVNASKPNHSDAPITLTFAPGLQLHHPVGEIRVRQTSTARSILINGRPTFRALPGDVLVVIELDGEFSDNFKSAVGNYMGLESADGKSLLAPQLIFEFTPGKPTLSRSPQSMVLLNQVLEPVDRNQVKTVAVHRGWVAIAAVKLGSTPIYLRLPCIAERVRL